MTGEWAYASLFVKRKGTKAGRKIPENFEETRNAFHTSIRNIVEEHDIPDALNVNWDLTGVSVVPVDGLTLEEHL
ncbi:Hypp715 [Branchiostoma lanceolatum]|uniref:Hypp715 protein n=1 Tax=Branchiostoma lanceolatum TaxID=7740 RepID=A0A8J9YPI0_BRALA|nr:Hypp715 [Branchiostoma lanceolatum]